MTLIELLKDHSKYWGIDAPTFSWWAACVLLVVPLCTLVYLWWLVRRESRTLESTGTSIEQLKAKNVIAPGHGLSATVYESLVQIFSRGISLSASWNAFNSLVVGRRN